MANPHFEIKITKRSKRQSAVAGAAYQSGENLFSEYDQKHKDYRKKEGVVYTEIMLPSHAPPEYADREQLWNAVEAVENQWNSQLARRFVLALPREVPEELYPQMVQDYCNQFFVSKGMIVDFAIHDPKPPGHNPHCHVMLTMRAISKLSGNGSTALCLSTHHFLKRRELKVKTINTGYMVRAPTPCAYRGRKPHPYN